MFLRIVSGQSLHICGLAIMFGTVAAIASDASAQEKSCGSCHHKLWPSCAIFQRCPTPCANHDPNFLYNPTVWLPAPQDHIVYGPQPLTAPVQPPAGEKMPNPRPAEGQSVPKKLPFPDGAKPSPYNPQR